MADDATDEATDDATEPEPGDQVRRGLEHLQTAATELIAAARAMLDACEEVVNDPEALRTAASGLSNMAKAVARSAGVTGRTGEPDGEDDDGRHGVEHIPVT